MLENPARGHSALTGAAHSFLSQPVAPVAPSMFCSAIPISESGINIILRTAGGENPARKDAASPAGISWRGSLRASGLYLGTDAILGAQQLNIARLPAFKQAASSLIYGSSSSCLMSTFGRLPDRSICGSGSFRGGEKAGSRGGGGGMLSACKGGLTLWLCQPPAL